MNKSFKKNLLAAFSAQGVSLLISILMSLFVPKILGITEFSYWQLFIFYIGYAGFFHFGYNDGLYLKLGGKDYKDLNHSSLGKQFRIFIFFQILISFLLLGLFVLFPSNSNRFVIFIVSIIYMIISNSSTFLGFIFQAVNLTRVYSFSIIIDRIFVLVSIIFLVFLKVNYFFPFIVLYTFSKFISLLYCIYKSKEIVFSCNITDNFLFSEMIEILKIGFKLMLANIASMLILGIGRISIDSHWGIQAFGKISLALSLTNFFLLFIQQVSMVMFPALRRVDKEKLVKIFIQIREMLGLILPLIFVFYSPIYLILSHWLPEYSSSLKYMILLLPICTFDGKMQMLFNTYFKVTRNEAKLLFVNLISLLASIIFVFISVKIFDSFILVVCSMLLAVMIRSIISDLYFSKLFQIKVYKQIFSELFVVIMFITLTWNLPILISFFANSLIYIIFLLLNKNLVVQVFRNIRRGNYEKK
ncbi:lipopolysaccharide biosynthesis protein [Streptococcus uberis]|uniref:lipopolysaccharide biosynthesis protein n=5 Tax=Streptococcus uberis TaxID=1349 RepID=UPI0020BD54EB|nr:hypothetical protein [Streptococcus uberis]